jgi:hypothetical protein
MTNSKTNEELKENYEVGQALKCLYLKRYEEE